MSRTFLNTEQIEKYQKQFSAPKTIPRGFAHKEFDFPAIAFSQEIGVILENIFSNDPDWEKAEPIIIGSWARGELTPKSDYDFIFVGSEQNVKNIVDRFHAKGMKIRYRIPANLNDWSEGVEVFDVLALLKARPMTKQAEEKLNQQQLNLKKLIYKNRKKYLKGILQERSDRAERYDSIANYLEMNIKYGPGGLRDLEQGLQIYELFSDKFINEEHAVRVLHYYKEFWLTIRHKLHLEGFNDTLSSQSQFDLAKWFGYQDQKDFMREVERGLSRVHFYANWIAEVALSSDEKIAKYEKVHFKDYNQILRAIKKDSCLLMQKKVREQMDRHFTQQKILKISKDRGRFLNEILSVKSSDKILVGVFTSRLIDKLLPDIRHLIGYVQHDQYHRFTADIHIQQACRELKRVYKYKKTLGALKNSAQKLKKVDWEILGWTCLFHDLAKGLEYTDKDTSHHHSQLGIEIVQRNFRQFGLSQKLSHEVQWMVEQHLELSVAAFRKNPSAQSTWDDLLAKGCEGQRLHRLAVFTAIDIRATNPEAWNDWKAGLLNKLVESMDSQTAKTYFGFKKILKRKRIDIDEDLMNQLDPMILAQIKLEKLVDDLKIILNKKDIEQVKVFTNKKNTWIRFHNFEDKTGLLANYVQTLYSLGLNIRQASIQTLPQIGVYDWFQVTTKKSADQLQKLFKYTALNTRPIPEVKFNEISLVSADKNEWVISFKAIDQSGLLTAAAAALSEFGCQIKSAKVHTWGRQVDDIFMIQPMSSKDELIEKLRQKLIN